MEENNLEQNIDPILSSQIDQITKVPETKPKSKPKVKNPAKVAAGKKLADFNRRAKAKQKAVQENDEVPVENEEESSLFFHKTSLTSIIAVLGLGLTGLDLFLRYKGQSNYSRTVENNNEPDESEYEDVTKMKVINDPQHIGGME